MEGDLGVGLALLVIAVASWARWCWDRRHGTGGNDRAAAVAAPGAAARGARSAAARHQLGRVEERGPAGWGGGVSDES
jgi:hypothetical protein